jgi:multicomponent Na+:H+ antiporter subunit D
VGYIYKYTGTLSLYEAAYRFAEISTSYQILPYALLMTFVTLKCAFVPLYSWLPRAHGTPGAPSSVSAILSGLHIKSSVYLFLRFHYTFEQIAATEFFLIVGIVTAIWGFIMALAQTDIKLILAYHTISQVGFILTGLNIGGPYSHIGSLYHMINHALFKSTLFLSAGIIANAYGTRDLYQIKGVFKRMPLVGVATILAVFGITGTPIFNGSISKYFIMSGIEGALNWLLIFMSLGTIISFTKYSSMLFGSGGGAAASKKVDIWQQVPILVLGSLCFFGGIFGAQFIIVLFKVDVSIDTAGYFEKAGVFFISLAAGFLIYKYYITKSRLLKTVRKIDLGFRGICVAIGMFFATILLVAGVFYA